MTFDFFLVLQKDSWKILRRVVHWSPFIQHFKKNKYPWIQLAGHHGTSLLLSFNSSFNWSDCDQSENKAKESEAHFRKMTLFYVFLLLLFWFLLLVLSFLYFVYCRSSGSNSSLSFLLCLHLKLMFLSKTFQLCFVAIRAVSRLTGLRLTFRLFSILPSDT